MILQVAIVVREEQCEKILKKFADAGINGSTVVDCAGSATAISDDEYMCQQPVFSGLRAMVKQNSHLHKMILSVVDEDKRQSAHDIAVQVLGDLSKPNTGIIFALPLIYAEGIEK